jgi:multidrug efflux pump subunit AcrA (membrane-fusion protein)
VASAAPALDEDAATPPPEVRSSLLTPLFPPTASPPAASPPTSSAPTIGTPRKPLTEETAMPPVLPLGWKSPDDGGARPSTRNGTHAPDATPIPGSQPAGPPLASVTPLHARGSSGGRSAVEATIPEAAPARPALQPPLETTLPDNTTPVPLRRAVEAAVPDSLSPTAVGRAPARPAAAPRRPPSPVLYAGLGLATAALVAFGFYRSATTSEPAALPVRTVIPPAGSVYRWFDAVGTVKPGGEHTLSFSTAGKVASVLAAGSLFHPGDVIAELEGAKRYKTELAHHAERLAHYEKTLDSARASGDRPEARQAEIKVAEKKRLISEAQAKMAREAVIAAAPGEVAEAVATVGAMVKPGAPAVHTKGTGWRAELELSREDADRLRQLGFCHVEIDGKPLDCSLSAEGGDETHVAIDLPNDPAVAVGKPVRVARARFDGVFVLPASALVPSKGPDHRVYVARDGHAEPTAVILVDQTPTEIVVSQGLEPGSAVIVDAPATLRPRTLIRQAPVR